jgi:hypothetical protein
VSKQIINNSFVHNKRQKKKRLGKLGKSSSRFFIWLRPGLNPDAGYLVVVSYVSERRHGLAAFGYRHEAAWVESAAGGRIKRAGHFALEDNALTGFFDKRVGDGHGGKKCPRVRVQGIFIKHP